jgi:hypothetical protein
MRQARKVVVTRDPRDILVSLYFSVKLSHRYSDEATPQLDYSIKQQKRDAELSIDDFCLAYAWILNAEMTNLRFVLEDEQTLVLRYEDFIYDKMRLGRSLCEWSRLDVREERLAEIVAQYDVFPDSPQPERHIRQVHPETIGAGCSPPR